MMETIVMVQTPLDPSKEGEHTAVFGFLSAASKAAAYNYHQPCHRPTEP